MEFETTLKKNVSITKQRIPNKAMYEMIFNPLIIILEFMNVDFIDLFKINLLFKLETICINFVSLFVATSTIWRNTKKTQGCLVKLNTYYIII